MNSYSIGEVSRILGVKQHVIRYWEQEIPLVSPRKNLTGRRIYTEKDVQILLRIKHHLYTNRFTIDGAKKKIWSEINGGNTGVRSQIALIRSDLLDILRKAKRLRETNPGEMDSNRKDADE